MTDLVPLTTRLNSQIVRQAPGTRFITLFVGSYEPATMKVSTWKKDMAIIAEFADDVGCATPLFTLTQPVYTEALAMGLGDQDTAAVFEVLKKTIVRTPKSGTRDRQ